MKVAFLASANSWHTVRWYDSLKSSIEVKVYTIEADSHLPTNDIVRLRDGNKIKLGYLLALDRLRRELSKFKPDIVHSHYATGYGLLGALGGHRPLVVSVWGSDVFEFPNKSFVHKAIIKYVLKKADRICTTSKKIRDRCIELLPPATEKTVVIPFGVDTNIFSAEKRDAKKPEIVIGTAKKLEPIYQIDKLMMMFDSVCENHPDLKLRIAGDGVEAGRLLELKTKLKHGNKIEFMGTINNSELPSFLNRLDIFVMPSRFESFGVAALEASACGLPVVGFDVGGLSEVVINEMTGILVKASNGVDFQEALIRLIEDESLRFKLGNSGRAFVEKTYNIQNSVQMQLDIYHSLLS